ncbi:MAG: hypothetical protein GY896_22480 [Gammaproteobacteria bacterium]|nr:hypothetical protein [Gammaproteobacteria bacterium]
MSVEQQLKQELAALRHELRRVSDSLERGSTHDMEQRARQLRANIEHCETELKRYTGIAIDSKQDITS